MRPDILDLHPDMPYDMLTQKVSGSCAEIPPEAERLPASRPGLVQGITSDQVRGGVPAELQPSFAESDDLQLFESSP